MLFRGMIGDQWFINNIYLINYEIKTFFFLLITHSNLSKLYNKIKELIMLVI